MDQAPQQSRQEQERPPQRNGPPAGWRYYSQAKHRWWLREWLAQVWRGVKNNAALVSAFLALFGVLLTLLINTWLAQQEQARQQALENDRAQRELALAERQAQQETLQTYLGDMGELILRDTSPLGVASAGDEVSRLARAKTLTVLLGLDGQSKRILLQFLKEEALINTPSPIVNLRGADLSYADLSSVDEDRNQLLLDGTHLAEVNLHRAKMQLAVLNKSDLSSANLSNANLGNAYLSNANLSNAYLGSANLSYAFLINANLSEADLSNVNLINANLSEADLSYAFLINANLSEADLSNVNLSRAFLYSKGMQEVGVARRETTANLTGADLTGANLEGATVYEEQLSKAKSLKGATMPDGQTLKGARTPDGPTFEEWLKSKGSGEDGENSGPRSDS